MSWFAAPVAPCLASKYLKHWRRCVRRGWTLAAVHPSLSLPPSTALIFLAVVSEQRSHTEPRLRGTVRSSPAVISPIRQPPAWATATTISIESLSPVTLNSAILFDTVNLPSYRRHRLIFEVTHSLLFPPPPFPSLFVSRLLDGALKVAIARCWSWAPTALVLRDTYRSLFIYVPFKFLEVDAIRFTSSISCINSVPRSTVFQSTILSLYTATNDTGSATVAALLLFFPEPSRFLHFQTWTWALLLLPRASSGLRLFMFCAVPIAYPGDPPVRSFPQCGRIDRISRRHIIVGIYYRTTSRLPATKEAYPRRMPGRSPSNAPICRSSFC